MAFYLSTEPSARPDADKLIEQFKVTDEDGKKLRKYISQIELKCLKRTNPITDEERYEVNFVTHDTSRHLLGSKPF